MNVTALAASSGGGDASVFRGVGVLVFFPIFSGAARLLKINRNLELLQHYDAARDVALGPLTTPKLTTLRAQMYG